VPPGVRAWQESVLDVKPAQSPCKYDVQAVQAVLALDAGDAPLIDSHCHIDFIYKRYHLNAEEAPKTFREFVTSLGPEWPRCMAEIVAVFCQPYTWFKVRLTCIE